MPDAAAHDALSAELLRHGRYVRAVAAGLVGPENADDAVQDAWLAALRSPPAEARSPRAWFVRVVRNAALKFRRSETRRREREEVVAASEASTALSDALERERVARRAMDAVSRLDADARALVALRFYEGLSADEIGRRLGLTPGAVRTRLSRALARVREDLDRTEPGGRAAWAAALLPLATPAFEAAAAAAATAGGIAAATATATGAIGVGSTAAAFGGGAATFTFGFGGLLVAKKLLVAAAVAALVAATVYLSKDLFSSPETPAPPTLSGRTDDAPPTPRALEGTGENVAPIARSPFQDDVDDGGFGAESDRPGAPSETVRVFGRVVDVAGGPVAGAAVRARTSRDVDGFGVRMDKPVETSTDANGVFSLQLAAGAEANVRVRPTREADAVRKARLPTTGSLDLGVLVVREGATVEGTVRDESGRPVADATVAVRAVTQGSNLFGRALLDNDEDRTAKTDAAGKYVVVGVSPGDGRVVASSPDRPSAARHDVQFAAGKTTRDVDLVLNAGRTVVGRVTDAAGSPIAGASVRVFAKELSFIGSAPAPRDSRTVKSDADGRFEAKGLGSSSLQAAARFPGYRPGEISVEREGPAVIRLEATSTLWGRVIGPDGTPGRGVRVEVRAGTMGRGTVFAAPPKAVYGSDAARILGVADEAGLWCAPNNALDDVDVLVRAEGAAAKVIEGVGSKPGEKVEVPCALEPERVIAGIVKNAAGEPVVGATVNVEAAVDDPSEVTMTGGSFRAVRRVIGGPSSWYRMIEPVKSGAGGTYVVAGVPDGNYDVSATAPGCVDAPAVRVAVSAAAPRVSCDLALGAAGAVKGVAYEADGTVASGVRVFLKSGGMNFGLPGRNDATTDAEGRFEISGVAPGTYVVAREARRDNGDVFFAFSGSGEQPAPKAGAGEALAVVVSGGVAVVELRDPHPASLIGVVTDGGKPAAGIVVILRAEKDHSFFGEGGSRATTDHRGEFTFEGRAPGAYVVVVEPPGAPDPIETRVELEAGQTRRETIALPSGVVEGRVVDSAGAPVAGAKMSLKKPAKKDSGAKESESFAFVAIRSGGDGSEDDLGTETFAFGGDGARRAIETDRDGRYVLRHVAPGDYVVEAKAKGFVTGKREGVVVREGATTSGVDVALSAGGSIVATAFGGEGTEWVVIIFTPVDGGAPIREHGPVGEPKRRDGLTPGRWKVVAEAHDGSVSPEKIVDVVAGRAVEVRLDL